MESFIELNLCPLHIPWLPITPVLVSFSSTDIKYHSLALIIGWSSEIHLALDLQQVFGR